MHKLVLRKDFRLTDRELALVDAVKAGGDPREFVGKNGYANHEAVLGILSQPHVAAAIEYELARHLVTRLAPLALRHYEKVLARDSKASNADKNAAARAVLDRAGFVPPKAPDKTPESSKDISEMSPDQLRRLIGTIEGELADRATPVESGDSPTTDDVVDLL